MPCGHSHRPWLFKAMPLLHCSDVSSCELNSWQPVRSEAMVVRSPSGLPTNASTSVLSTSGMLTIAQLRRGPGPVLFEASGIRTVTRWVTASRGPNCRLAMQPNGKRVGSTSQPSGGSIDTIRAPSSTEPSRAVIPSTMAARPRKLPPPECWMVTSNEHSLAGPHRAGPVLVTRSLSKSGPGPLL